MEEFCREKIKLVSEGADVAIVFAGLNHGRGGDSESMDRKSLHLDSKQVSEIKEIAAQNQHTVVCLIAGSPIAMDEWIDAHSTGDSRNYPGDDEKRVFYDEGIFVGYRWFDEKKIDPLFPFGFGKSYTEFEYSAISFNQDVMGKSKDALEIQIELQNVGELAGSEVIQIYSRDLEASVDRPPHELVGFEKVHLSPGERKSVSVTMKIDDLAFYDTSKKSWVIEDGDFKLLVGKSSREIVGETDFTYG